MKHMTPRQMANACSGILHFPEGSETVPLQEVTSVVTDSRKAVAGCLFAAIRGERSDGHSFIPAVLEAGAACILCERDLTEEDIPSGKTVFCWIRVRSTLAALRDIAEYYLQELGIPAVGIAGSVGKTSTKEMTAAVLSRKYRVLKTQGNFNNELGVPLTIFRLTEEDEIAVLEMGISEFGEMHRLSRIVHPDTVIMTNIGECHLEFLKDRDGVLRAKSEIFDFLKEEGNIVLNGNDDKLVTLQNVNGITPVFYGIREETPKQDLDVYAEEITPLGLRGTRALIRTPAGSFTCTIPIPGRHMVMNALAGTAAGLIYHLSLEEIRQGIESLQPVSGRFHIVETDSMTVIDDCYNANPISMKASLSVLKDALTRRVAILGDMAELGPEEEQYHREVGAYAADSGVDLLVTIGERGAWIREGFLKQLENAGGDASSQSVHFESAQAFLAEAGKWMNREDTVLVKASHCMQFETIVEALCS